MPIFSFRRPHFEAVSTIAFISFVFAIISCQSTIVAYFSTYFSMIFLRSITGASANRYTSYTYGSSMT